MSTSFLVVSTLACVSLSSCATRPAQPTTAEAEEERIAPLETQPLEEYLPASGVSWLVQLRPSALVGDERLRKDWEKVISSQNLSDFTRVSGFEPRGVDEAWLAGYPLGTLFLFDSRIVGRDYEEAFRNRSRSLQERATGHPDLVHITAVVDDEPQALVHLRGHFIAVLQRDITLAKIIVADALGKLQQVPSALATRFLAPFREFSPEAPVRALLLGPFEEASDPVSMEFVSGALAVAVHDGQLDLRLNALGVWPHDSAAVGALDDWMQQVLQTREMRALGLGFPVQAPHPSCKTSQVVKDATLTQCQAQGVWSSAQVAAAVYHVTAAPLSEMLPENNPSRWQPATTPRESDPNPIGAPTPSNAPEVELD